MSKASIVYYQMHFSFYYEKLKAYGNFLIVNLDQKLGMVCKHNKNYQFLLNFEGFF